MLPLLLIVISLLSRVQASPAPAPSSNNPTPTLSIACTAITSIIPASSATPFCSSYLSITDKTIYTTISDTLTVTVTASEASTSIVFQPGNGPPGAKERRSLAYAAISERNNSPSCNRDNCLRNLVDDRYSSSVSAFCNIYTTTTTSIAVPTFVKNCGDPPSPSRISSACSCLFPPTTTSGPAYTTSACSCLGLTASTATFTAIADIVTTVTIPAGVTTKTVYPCASPLSSPGPAYRLAGGNIPPNTQNSLLGLDTPEGASAEACCNACFFSAEVPNCIQAFFYFYEGCVVSQGIDVLGSGEGVSVSCPNGKIRGLTYGPDGVPPFRSTGDIAGPCGELYSGY